MIKFSNFYLGRAILDFFSILNISLKISEAEKKFKFLILFSILVIFLEGYSLSLIFDISNLVINKDFETKNYLLNKISIKDQNQVFLVIIIFFIFIFVKNILQVLFVIFKNNFIINSQKIISLKLLSNFYDRDYNFFINKNSSQLISILLQDVSFLIKTLTAILHILVDLLLLLFILGYLFYINFSSGIFFIFGLFIYFIIYFSFTKKKLLSFGAERDILYQNIIKNLSQSLLNFRELIIYNCKEFFFNKIENKYQKFFLNLYKANNLQQTSRVLIEQVFIVILILLFSSLIYFKINADAESIVPLLAVYLFAFLKLLPSYSRIIQETQSYLTHKLFVTKIYQQLISFKDLNQDEVKDSLDFTREINIENVSFSFPNQEINNLNKLNIKIFKYEKIGIIGKSGSGKTTFLNLLMGFLKPKEGRITVDKKNINSSIFQWRKKIAYVSQSIYLLDESIWQNITLEENFEKIDQNELNQSIKNSGLDQFIKNLPNGIHAVIGERGSKISGGEILRIALARAFYSKKDIFILDEFTSALDQDTENKILDNLKNCEKTIVIVSHKKSALKYCSKIYELSSNGLLSVE